MTGRTAVPLTALRLPGRGAWSKAAGMVASMLLVLTVLTVLAGCGGDSGDSGDASAASPGGTKLGTVTIGADGVQEVTIQTPDDFVFTPDHVTVEPGEVRLTVVNVAKQMTHNFQFTDGAGPAPLSAGIDLLPPGQKATITFTVEAPGDYPFECSFHDRQGQVGTMTVNGP